MPAANDSSFQLTSLNNIKQNGEILLAMTNVTDEDGQIAELAGSSAASNMLDVYEGTFNHFKIAHAKKTLVCNVTKGASADDDVIGYDIIVRYNSTNSATLSTVLCSINASNFLKIKDADRATLVDGVVDSSNSFEVSWDKLSALKDLSAYLTMHTEFHDAVNVAITAVKPFAA